ncbi:MAG: hypothetical protein KDD61_07995 [Bdellovibrionales bacterium]|nr:hypothetical protein [Bdellovibrionales bacterium]
MKESLVKFLSCCWLLATVGCASGVLTIDSNEREVDISVRYVGDGEYKPLGKTPLTMEASKVIEVAGNKGKAMVIELTKPGYMSRTVLVPNLDSGTDFNFRLQLTRQASERAEDIAEKNKLIDDLFESQRLVKVGRYDDAIKLLDKIGEREPQLAAIFEMKAGVSFIKKDYTSSLDLYRQALRLNPGNVESLKMVQYLESLNTRKPANENEPTP